MSEDIQDLMGGDPAESKAPRKPRKKKLQVVLDDVHNSPIVQDLKDAVAGVSEAFASIAEGTATNTVATVAVAEAPASPDNPKGKFDSVPRGTERPISRFIPENPKPSAPEPNFKYEYQRIEYRKRLELLKGK